MYNIDDEHVCGVEKAKQMKERTQTKKEQQIDGMTNEEVVNELKEKKLPTFGTGIERKERLKKHYGRFIISNIYEYRVDYNYKWSCY